MCIIYRMHKIEQCFNYMHAKIQVAGFQNKKDKHHCFSYLVCLFLLGHLPVQVSSWFLASDGSEIHASVEDFRPINLNFTSNICYLLYHTLIKFSVFVVCGSVIFQYTTVDPCDKQVKNTFHYPPQFAVFS